MKSIAIKTNNSQILEYLQNEFLNLELDNIYISCRNFKHYTNLIIHYTGDEPKSFLDKLSNIISFLIIYEFEDRFLKQIILKNYFYFSSHEREIILNNCFNTMVDSKTYLKDKFNILYETIFQYLSNNKNLFLNGFIDFKLFKYYKLLNIIVDESVNNFLIEKEYQEFVSLLKLYINSQKCNSTEIHVVYSDDFTIILDENKNIIENSKDISKTKFLSDITFSTNDYTLNTLLNLLPKKLYIHLINNTIDDFINTLNLIFEKRIKICTDCNICTLYKNIKKDSKLDILYNHQNKKLEPKL